MKRVHLMAAAVPAAIGLAIPAAAQAAATTHHHTARNYDHCLYGLFSCVFVGGNQNWIGQVEDSHWPLEGVGYIGYKDVPGYPARSKWRAAEMSLYTGGRPYTYQKTWYPNCSFPTSTRVYGYTSYDHTKQSARIYGSNFTGTHKCA